MNNRKGLMVDIYKHNNRSCDGIANFSSRYTECILLPSPDFPSVPMIFEEDEDLPAVILKKDVVMGKEIIRAFPVDADGKIMSTMFSGSFIWVSDSRFPIKYPVMLMDRIEEKL